MAEARAAYRSVFRSLSRHVTSESSSKWHAFVRTEFDRLAKVGDAKAMQQALQAAKDYADLIRSVDSHKVPTLYFAEVFLAVIFLGVGVGHS